MFTFNLKSTAHPPPQNNTNPLASMLSGAGSSSGTIHQSLEQLLERQWEQGSQFLMEQAQHFDSKFYFLVVVFCKI